MASLSDDEPDHAASYYDIYPPIAVGRCGDSEDWYIGPEVPGIDPVPERGFKDNNHRILRSAPRFRVYAFNSKNEVIEEITAPQYTVKWTVHVANHKGAWVRFRGQYAEEKWELRNPRVQPWNDGEEPDYEYCDTRNKLIIDPGERSISGRKAYPVPLEGQFWGSQSKPTTVHLGALHTDEAGRLIVVPGDGHSFSVLHNGKPPEQQPFQSGYFDNDDWFDCIFDGHVYATVNIAGEDQKCKNHATVSSAPPHFANGFQSPTTAYDTIEDIYERQKYGNNLEDYDGVVDYNQHIYPLFQRLYMLGWSNKMANRGHGAMKVWMENPAIGDPKDLSEETKAQREAIFKRIRLPVRKPNPEQFPTSQFPNIEQDRANVDQRYDMAEDYYMPPLGGNAGDPLTILKELEMEQRKISEGKRKERRANGYTSLTTLQYRRLKKWSDGEFVSKPGEIKKYSVFSEIPLQEQPNALRLAGLEWSVGAPLYPGIEYYWVFEFGNMYNLEEPFRFSRDTAKPGYLTRGLSLPWQADFHMCRTHWWPSVRPDDVVPEEYFEQMGRRFQKDPENLAPTLYKRRAWDRGLDVKAYLPGSFDERYGNSEMVRKWFKLGFVKTISYGGAKARIIAVEVERDPDLPDKTDSEDPVPAPS